MSREEQYAPRGREIGARESLGPLTVMAKLSSGAGAGAVSGAKVAPGSGRCRGLLRPSAASGLRQRRRGQGKVAAVRGPGARPHCAGAGASAGSGTLLVCPHWDP